VKNVARAEGVVWHNLGECARALPPLRNALELFTAAHGATHPLTTGVLDYVGICLAATAGSRRTVGEFPVQGCFWRPPARSPSPRRGATRRPHADDAAADLSTLDDAQIDAQPLPALEIHDREQPRWQTISRDVAIRVGCRTARSMARPEMWRVLLRRSRACAPTSTPLRSGGRRALVPRVRGARPSPRGVEVSR
jgi:hypothetical protein